ncbi:hypothetical protein WA026_023525 [Henosepilachna vigintioctopunctata]|uniref:Cytochrome P450 n=1 Tax=Henosepilachna vigintioctopunctata TaxID=420089 RepID=A0AAW1TZY1_9CUCU
MRKQMNIKRSDMFELLMEERYGKKRVEETEESIQGSFYENVGGSGLLVHSLIVLLEPEEPEEKSVTLDVDEYAIIPILAVYHDSQYFEDPEKFIPERFSSENRRNIITYTYFPFGVCPRNCIGSRFALLEIKAVLFHILCHFEIVPTQETNIPLQIDKSSFNVKSVNGFPLGLKRRV